MVWHMLELGRGRLGGCCRAGGDTAQETLLERGGVEPEAEHDQAARALGQGDARPARALIDDRLFDELVVHGAPEVVGAALAERLGPLRPTSIGVALLADDPLGTLEPAAKALSIAAREIAV